MTKSTNNDQQNITQIEHDEHHYDSMTVYAVDISQLVFILIYKY